MRSFKKSNVKKAKMDESVNNFLSNLIHPLKNEIITVRQIILNADSNITETIKWNAPNFCYNGEDRITFRLQPSTHIQLIFHRGAKVRADSKDFKFSDETGLLKWITNDRATLTFKDLQEIKEKEMQLTKVVTKWMVSTT